MARRRTKKLRVASSQPSNTITGTYTVHVPGFTSTHHRQHSPGDEESQFAEEHLLAWVPWVRSLVGPRWDKWLIERKLREEVPFRQLPVCYALAVLKVCGVDSDSINTITDAVFVGKIGTRWFSDRSLHVGWVDEGRAAWLGRLLLGMCKLELGFGTQLLVWERKNFSCRIVQRSLRNLAAIAASVEAAEQIVEIQKASLQELPLVPVERARECIKIDPEMFLSKSIRRFAFDACACRAVSVLRFLLETHPATFTNMAEHRSESNSETYLECSVQNGHADVFRVLAAYMKRPPYSGKAKVVAAVNGDMNLPFLIDAMRQGNEAMARSVLESGADSNFVPYLESALYIACDKNYPELIDLLVAHGADPLERDLLKHKPLLKCQTASAAKALLEAVAAASYRPHPKRDRASARFFPRQFPEQEMMAQQVVKKLRAAPSQPSNPATALTLFMPHDQRRITTALIASVPPEIARRIVLHLHPADLASLIRASLILRKVFCPADTEVHFALEHLQARFPAPPKGGKKRQYTIHPSVRYKLRSQVPFRQLPLCYALAVLKLGEFDKDSFRTATEGAFAGETGSCTHQPRTDPVDPRRAAWLERLLLVGTGKLELGFEMQLFRWKDAAFMRKEAKERWLYLAAFVDSVPAVQRILEIEKASVERVEMAADRNGAKGINGDPEDVSSRLQSFAFAACRYGGGSVLSFLLEAYPETFSNMHTSHRCRVDYLTYMQHIFHFHHTELLKILVHFIKLYRNSPGPVPIASGTKYCPELSSLDAENEFSLLQTATLRGAETMVRVLLELGADPNFVSWNPVTLYPTRIWDPFHCRVVTASKDSCRAPTSGCTPLHIACNHERLQLIPLLLAHGADPLAQNGTERTPLMMCRCADAVTVLLGAVERYAPDAMRSLYGGNALHIAAAEWNVPVFKTLLKAIEKVSDADEDGRAFMKTLFVARNKDGWTPLTLACQVANGESMLEDADPRTIDAMREVLPMADGQGCTPVHVAAMYGRTEMLRTWLGALSASNDGMREKVLGMKRFDNGDTPLHLAI
ncbi:hypothetical protein HDU96_010086 [Phlyctochytrium bullatum]|nr:hypothetical protein HDU96_010086 [Phlyctochytrium bullatum]